MLSNVRARFDFETLGLKNNSYGVFKEFRVLMVNTLGNDVQARTACNMQYTYNTLTEIIC